MSKRVIWRAMESKKAKKACEAASSGDRGSRWMEKRMSNGIVLGSLHYGFICSIMHSSVVYVYFHYPYM